MRMKPKSNKLIEQGYGGHQGGEWKVQMNFNNKKAIFPQNLISTSTSNPKLYQLKFSQNWT